MESIPFSSTIHLSALVISDPDEGPARPAIIETKGLPEILRSNLGTVIISDQS